MKIDHIHPNYENADKKKSAVEKILVTVYGEILTDRKKRSKSEETAV